MSNRIPPSLNWLVKNRSKIDGKIIKLKSDRETYLEWCNNQITKLTADLEAVDRTLTLHKIKINPQIIPPLQSRPINQKLKYGELTKLIIECIKTSPNNAATAYEIKYYVAIQKNLEVETSITSSTFDKSIRNRIKNLCREGILIRLPLGKEQYYRKYRLP